MKFAVLGGDMRILKLTGLLAADGHTVHAYGMERLPPEPGVTQAETLQEACSGANAVLLPLPATNGQGAVTTPLSSRILPAEAALQAVEMGCPVFAGRVTPDLSQAARKAESRLVDYFLREELTVANAAATAEGAVQLLMEETDACILGLRVLVIGYGRIGKLTAHRLRAMGAHVTVSARKCADIAWIRAMGYIPAETEQLHGTLGDYDAVVNTVPALVLDEGLLTELKPGCVCIDLASRPGGLDFTAASRLGIRAVWALGLPGEVAPRAAAAAIRETVYNILREGGDVL